MWMQVNMFIEGQETYIYNVSTSPYNANTSWCLLLFPLFSDNGGTDTYDRNIENIYRHLQKLNTDIKSLLTAQ